LADGVAGWYAGELRDVFDEHYLVALSCCNKSSWGGLINSSLSVMVHDMGTCVPDTLMSQTLSMHAEHKLKEDIEKWQSQHISALYAHNQLFPLQCGELRHDRLNNALLYE
jgi:hypothetical protein